MALNKFDMVCFSPSSWSKECDRTCVKNCLVQLKSIQCHLLTSSFA